MWKCGRWLSGSEALLLQGFPVHPVLHKGLKLSSYHFPNPSRSSRTMRTQAGNSMHVGAITVQILYVLLYAQVMFSVVSF